MGQFPKFSESSTQTAPVGRQITMALLDFSVAPPGGLSQLAYPGVHIHGFSLPRPRRWILVWESERTPLSSAPLVCRMSRAVLVSDRFHELSHPCCSAAGPAPPLQTREGACASVISLKS